MITKLHIEKFCGFQNIDCDLGSQITAIVGQNGTQKTVLLGLLSQPFSIKDRKVKRLCVVVITNLPLLINLSFLLSLTSQRITSGLIM